MMPSCDQTGVPGDEGLIHFNSSTTAGSASLMSLRILLRVSPRQSPSSAIRFEIRSDADWPWLAPDSVMLSSYSGFGRLLDGGSQQEDRLAVSSSAPELDAGQVDAPCVGKAQGRAA